MREAWGCWKWRDQEEDGEKREYSRKKKKLNEKGQVLEVVVTKGYLKDNYLPYLLRNP
jgi:hypothetical protein